MYKKLVPYFFQSVFFVHLKQSIFKWKKEVPIPENFSIGVSTAAFQIEGGWNEDGRGPSIWDTFTHKFPDKITNRSNADVACDSYHKFNKDLQALVDLRVNHYRFSISWNRIMTNGDNSTFNPKGVEYYNYVINELLKHNITPMVTMFHYDLPDELMKLGGMTNPEFVGYFEDYAKTLFQIFGDRVGNWITFNEPIDYCSGYGTGYDPPGISKSGIADYLCLQNTLKAHAVAYRAYKDHFYKVQKGKIGITLSTRFYFSKTNDFDVVNRAMQYGLGILAHPIYSNVGGYPEVVVQEISSNSLRENRPRSRLPQLDEYWRAMIKGSADFLGINYYTSRYVEEEDPPTGPVPSYQRDARLKFFTDPSWKRAKSNGLEDLLKYIRDEYDNVEVIITENGWSDNGEANDYDRVEYLRGHIQAVLNAVEDGCNVTGYTAWSLMDNFEWLMGFSEKFGLHYIDFNSQEKDRKPKLSSKFFTKLNIDRAAPPKGFKYF
uniref:Uncharacterized protein n=1 Tax=Megaselia scalaris TaxID=36166 RepID=T1GN17_MEGSC